MPIGFFPGLGIIIIRAIFNDLGHYSSRSVALNNTYIRFAVPSFGSSFNILAVTASRTGVCFLVEHFDYIFYFLK